MATLFTEGKFHAVNSAGAPLAGGKLYTYAAGTLTALATYTNQGGGTANANPVILDAAGRAAVWLGASSYRMILKDASDVTIWDVDNVATLGFDVPWVSVRPSGGDDTTAIQDALDSGSNVAIIGDVLANNLTASTNGQQIVGFMGRIIKNGNGPIMTVTANNVFMHGVQFRGELSTPVFTGNNLTITGDDCRLDHCGSRWAYAHAVECTGSGLSVIGSCDIYQTANGAASWDILVGTANTATYYHKIVGINTSQATGGIKLIAPGVAWISGCQFGKLTVDPGASPVGMHGPFISGCRITGATSIAVSNTAIDESSASADVTLTGTITGISIGDGFKMQSGTTLTIGANVSVSSLNVGGLIANGATVVNNATNNSVTRWHESYTPAWTAASVNPTLGDGTIVGDYTTEGKTCTANILLTYGSTSAAGTGVWRFSLPFQRSNTTLPISVGVARILDTGTAYYVGAAYVNAGSSVVEVVTNGASGAIAPTVPITWAAGDTVAITISYPIQ